MAINVEYKEEAQEELLKVAKSIAKNKKFLYSLVGKNYYSCIPIRTVKKIERLIKDIDAIKAVEGKSKSCKDISGSIKNWLSGKNP